MSDWKLGKDMLTSDTILDPVTFDDLILALKMQLRVHHAGCGHYSGDGDYQSAAGRLEVSDRKQYRRNHCAGNG